MAAEEFELDYTRFDIGELIRYVREERYKMSIDAFAHKINIQPSALRLAEQGKGAHVNTVFNKLAFKGMITDIRISLKVQP